MNDSQAEGIRGKSQERRKQVLDAAQNVSARKDFMAVASPKYQKLPV